LFVKVDVLFAFGWKIGSFFGWDYGNFLVFSERLGNEANNIPMRTYHLFIIFGPIFLSKRDRPRKARECGNFVLTPVVILDIVCHVAIRKDKVPSVIVPNAIGGAILPLEGMRVKIRKLLAVYDDIGPATGRALGNLDNLARLEAEKERHLCSSRLRLIHGACDFFTGLENL